MVWRKQVKGGLSTSLEQNLQNLQQQMAEGIDIVIRQFRLGNGRRAAAFFVDGLVNKDLLQRDFFRPLMDLQQSGSLSMTTLAEEVLHMGEIKLAENIDDMIDAVLQGLTALMVDGESVALVTEAIGWQQRGVNEPSTDVIIRGPREGFVETLRINVSLIRRKVHHSGLTVERARLGRYSQTELAIVYIDGVVNEEVLTELKERLAKIDIDAILDSGHVEQFIQDNPYSLFPTVGITEKPDIAAARILEGRVMLLVDGSPIALTVPMLFVEGLQSSEDYYTRFYYASLIRVVRALAFMLTVFLPGFYIAVTNYHHELIPVKLMLSMVAAEANTPFSTGFSVLIIGLVYEILREAGVRLPRPAGQAVSIVGAIVMGEAAVRAGLISAPVLIVLAFTVISSYVTVTLMDAATILRLIMIALGWAWGLFGLMLGAIFLLAYLCALTSFGAPYFSPLAPISGQGLRDSLLRFPLYLLNKRPSFLSPNRRRLGPWQPSKRARALFLTIALLLPLLLFGCVAQRQIADLAVVVGAGIDVAPENSEFVLLTVELARLKEQGGEGSPVLLSASGPTLAMARSNLEQSLEKELHWSHMQMLLVGEAAARHGLEHYLPLFHNNWEMSPHVYLALCEGEAREVLKGQTSLSPYVSGGLHDMLAKQQKNDRSYMEPLSLQGYMSNRAIPHCGQLIPLVYCVQPQPPAGATEEESPARLGLAGLAVLDENNRYAGRLLGAENLGAALFQSKNSRFMLALEDPDTQQKVSVRITGWRLKQRWAFAEDSIRLILQGYAQAQLEEGIAMPQLEELLSMELKRQIEAVWQRALMLETDFLGLGRALYSLHPQEWEYLREEWPLSMQRVELEVFINTRI